MGTKNLAEDPYEKLANAIIVQASKDYMTNLRKKKRNPGRFVNAFSVVLNSHINRAAVHLAR